MDKNIVVSTFPLSQYKGLVGEISYCETDNLLSLAFKRDDSYVVGPNAMELSRVDAIAFANALSQASLYIRTKVKEIGK